MQAETDEFDVYLQQWETNPAMTYAALPQNLNDPYIYSRTFDGGTTAEQVSRSEYVPGLKVLSGLESDVRHFRFFQEHQESWAADFRDYCISKGIPEAKLDRYLNAFATEWVDGRRRRQESGLMLAIKASIKMHDEKASGDGSARFVINSVADDIEPLFSPLEMAWLFEANAGLCEALLADYVDLLGDDGPQSVGWLPVRRGARMSETGSFRRELHYLSSYSLALGPVEQFAQTYQLSEGPVGVPSVFSAPLAAVQDRIVAFAPFIPKMELRQLELVVAHPLSEMSLIDHGEHGGLREYSFDFPTLNLTP